MSSYPFILSRLCQFLLTTPCKRRVHSASSSTFDHSAVFLGSFAHSGHSASWRTPVAPPFGLAANRRLRPEQHRLLLYLHPVASFCNAVVTELWLRQPRVRKRASSDERQSIIVLRCLVCVVTSPSSRCSRPPCPLLLLTTPFAGSYWHRALRTSHPSFLLSR